MAISGDGMTLPEQNPRAVYSEMDALHSALVSRRRKALRYAVASSRVAFALFGIWSVSSDPKASRTGRSAWSVNAVRPNIGKLPMR